MFKISNVTGEGIQDLTNTHLPLQLDNKTLQSVFLF